MNRLLMIVFSLALATIGANSGVVPDAAPVAPVAESKDPVGEPVVPVSAKVVPIAAGSADYPRYAFNYAVHDPVTKDNKAQWETRDGDSVRGSYQLVEPDGSLRVVDYAATDAAGFNAVVKNVHPNLHPTPLVAKAVGPHKAIAGPLNYGFGAAPINVGVPKIPSLGQWSLPWDPHTHSFGGWVPLTAPVLPLPIGPYATVFTSKYVDGKMHKWVTGPISLIGNTLVLKKKH